MKPILGITMGDAAGVGPEIIVKALMDPSIYEIGRPVVFGDKKIMERAVKIIGAELKCKAIDHPSYRCRVKANEIAYGLLKRGES